MGIREYLKIKYSAPADACKCGNCQLVPPEVIQSTAHTTEALIAILRIGAGDMSNAARVGWKQEVAKLLSQVEA